MFIRHHGQPACIILGAKGKIWSGDETMKHTVEKVNIFQSETEGAKIHAAVTFKFTL